MVLIWYLSILRRRQTSHLSPPYPSIRANSRGGSGFLPVPWHIGGSTTEEGFYIVRLFFGCCSVAAPWYRRLVSSVCGLFCDGWGRVETGGYIGVIFGKRPSSVRVPLGNHPFQVRHLLGGLTNPPPCRGDSLLRDYGNTLAFPFQRKTKRATKPLFRLYYKGYNAYNNYRRISPHRRGALTRWLSAAPSD